ncbi:sensor histidine kinase [Fodinicola feengrottensis]|uniref:sensor histidine kinase n=1 Tax=Fodinicola feengrottensis TaxID=435914 RepID=UPI0013D339E1|nr:histidine kinase [Fodinicola feengrottensis]
MRERLADGVLVLVLAAVFAVSGTWRSWADAGRWDAVSLALSIACIAALPLRRRMPATVLVVLTAATAGHLLLGASRLIYLPVLVALYAASLHGSRWVRWGLCAVATAVVTIAATTFAGVTEGGVLALVIFGVAWLLGAERHRHSAERSALLAEQARRGAEIQLAHQQHRAQAREREVIARRLHDALAHTVTVMLVQAEAVRTIGRLTSDDAVRVDQILAAGRDALAQVRATLADLHDPLPDATDLGGVLEQLRGAGLDIAPVPDLPSGPLVSRIVIEAATNALRHAGPGTAVDVRVEPAPRHCRLVVRSGPPAAGWPSIGPTPGRGLRGLAAEATEHGGRLAYGPTVDGGWTVTAELPRSYSYPGGE